MYSKEPPREVPPSGFAWPVCAADVWPGFAGWPGACAGAAAPMPSNNATINSSDKNRFIMGHYTMRRRHCRVDAVFGAHTFAEAVGFEDSAHPTKIILRVDRSG